MPPPPRGPSGRFGRQPPPTLEVFMPVGTREYVPFYLRATDDVQNMRVRKFPVTVLVDAIEECFFFAGAYLADRDRVGALEKKQGLVCDVPAVTTFADAFVKWLRSKHQAAPPPVLGEPDDVFLGRAAVEGADFSVELAYTMVHGAQTVYPTENIFCRLFLLLLSGDVPRDMFLQVRRERSAFEALFRGVDPDFTGSVNVMEVAHEIRTGVAYLSDSHADALCEIVEQHAASLGQGRVLFAPLLQRDSRFMQCAVAFFMMAAQFSLLRMRQAIEKEAIIAPLDGSGDENDMSGLEASAAMLDDLPSSVIYTALQDSDPQASIDDIRTFVNHICGATVTRATRVAVPLILRRLKEVYHRRQTPVPAGLFDPRQHGLPTHVAVAVQLALQNTGANAKGRRKSRVAPAK
jgi:hypothetical protein